MKITVEDNIKQFYLENVYNIYIGFDDNTEVKLSNVVEYNIDLDKIDCSIIEITNGYHDIEIANHFERNKRNHIIHVHIEANGYSIKEGKYVKVFYDIPCDMMIRKFRTNGVYNEIPGNMYIELEGIIK